MPTVGGARAMAAALSFASDPVGWMEELYRRHGPVVRLDAFGGLRRLGRPVIQAVGPAYNQAVLMDPEIWRTSRITLPGPRGSAQRQLGDNLVSLNGPRHKHYRGIVLGALRRPRVEAMGQPMGDSVEREIALWPLERPVDLLSVTRQLVRAVSVDLLFGGDRERGEALDRLMTRQVRLNASRRVVLCQIGLPGLPYRGLLRNAEDILRCCVEFVASRRGTVQRDDLLSLLVNAPDEHGKASTDRQIAGQVPILFAAAYETCQTALTWTLFLLAQHPAVAAQLEEEVRGALGGAPATLAPVAELPLLDAVIRESMRLLPPVPYQLRVAQQDAGLGEYRVERGTRVLLSAFLTNRLPALYEEPARFRPERWASLRRSPFEYLTFSGGPRLCPGSWFGTGVLKVAVAAALSRLSIAVVPGTRIDRRTAITLRPRDGLPVILRRAGEGGWQAAPVTGQIREMVSFPDPSDSRRAGRVAAQ
ncbi:MAG: cytochrome P450 [Dongiaceae bacterium]